jgi:hypothetical protein
VAAGTAAFSVNAPAGARVVLSDNAGLLARAEAGQGGQIVLVPARPLLAGETVRLTITGRNAVPYRVDLPVGEAATPVVDTVPTVASLLGNWPNPFNPSTTVGFTLPQAGPVRLSLHDARGRLVRVLVDEPLAAGSHEVRWDGRDLTGRVAASGVYLARLETARGRDVLTLTLAK